MYSNILFSIKLYIICIDSGKGNSQLIGLRDGPTALKLREY